MLYKGGGTNLGSRLEPEDTTAVLDPLDSQYVPPEQLLYL